jgi:two-component system NtrC family sensor kinase
MPSDDGYDFERDLGLQELLPGIDRQRLQNALEAIVEGPLAIFDSRGVRLLGNADAGADNISLPITWELEAIGHITAAVPEPRLRAATDLLNLLLHTNARYLMASDLHLQTQRADFEELERRHKALEISEQRYKALAKTLEQRVERQVHTIEQTRLKLYENEKLASVGRLAAGVAHEINNPIGFIRSNLTTASAYLDSLDKIAGLLQAGSDMEALTAAWQQEDMAYLQQDMRDIINESISGAERIAAIVKDLKSFSRIDETGHEPADINQIIRQVCNVAAAELRDKAELLLELHPLPMLTCHPGDLGQVFLSLLMNAVDAVSVAGKIRFRSVLEDTQIRIEVRDNGCGIPESVIPHIFDPFFTTKEVGKGVGLGLSVARNIVKTHGGTLEVKSRAGTGTQIDIVLPLKPAA